MSAGLSKAGEAVRRARRAKGLTQSELAEQVGCRQSAVSMFEAGRTGALAVKTVAAIAEKLGLDAKSLGGGSGVLEVEAAGTTLKYCPGQGCPSNVPYVVNDEVLFKPAMVRAPAGVKTWCSLCGEILEERCPNPDCGREANEGAFCPACGERYVAAGRACRGDPAGWADARRRAIAELMSLTRVAD